MKASWRENLEPKCRLEGAGRTELWEVLSRCSRASAKAPIKQFEASFAPQVLSFPDQRDTSTPVRPLEKKKEHQISVGNGDNNRKNTFDQLLLSGLKNSAGPSQSYIQNFQVI